MPDRGIVFLLSFLKGLFLAAILEIHRRLPRSLQSLRQRFHTNASATTQYVVCTKCSSLYPPNDCIVNSGSAVVSRKCPFIEFPNHPQRHRRTSCDNLLMKKVKCGSKYKRTPRSFIYNSVTKALDSILLRPGMLKREWRNYMCSDGYLSDIIDSRLRKEFVC